MATRKSGNDDERPKRPPAMTPEGREQQMISLAFDLAEERLRKGTATSQEVTHFLKLGTEREKLEREKLRRENILLKDRSEAMAAQKVSEELMERAIQAFRGYSGQEMYDED